MKTAGSSGSRAAFLLFAGLLVAATSAARAQAPFEGYQAPQAGLQAPQAAYAVPRGDYAKPQTAYPPEAGYPAPAQLPHPGLPQPTPTSETTLFDAYQAQPPTQTSQSSGADAALISRGQTAFQQQCAECHALSKATDEAKSLAGWKATVSRMASKTGSDVVAADKLAIATYLASLSAPSQPATTGAAAPAAAAVAPAAVEEQAFSMFSTLSPVWRGGGTTHLQHPGFFPQAWVGVDWQHGSSPVSAHATACITCHMDDGGDTFALVNATLRLDLSQAVANLRGSHEQRAFPNIRASVEAGRFVVPFGAYSKQVNPGVYRTVTRPLIFNMGQRIYDPDIGDPVLPMPYADEGAAMSFGAPIIGNVRATADVYFVNGLQGGPDGIAFDDSRNYIDNNGSSSGGARATLGNQYLTFGSSIVSGRFNPNGGSPMFSGRLNYLIFGSDISFKYKNIFRLQAEYARRNSDRVVALPGQLVATENVEGAYVLGEMRLLQNHDVHFISRYDVMDHGSPLPPPESSLAVGNFRVTRFTWGLNFGLRGGSLLMLNHEHWWVPGPLTNVDVVAVRWAGTY